MTLRSAWPLVQLGSWTATWSQAAEQTPGNHIALSCNRSHRVDSDPVCCRATDPDMTLFRSVGLDGTMNPVGTTSHQISVAPRLTWLLDAYMATSGSPDMAFLWPLVVTRGMDGHTDPDRALGSNPCLEVTRKPTSAYSSPPLLLPFHLFPQHVIHSASLSLPFLHCILAYHKGTHPSELTSFRQIMDAVLPAWVLRTRAILWVACICLGKLFFF